MQQEYSKEEVRRRLTELNLTIAPSLVRLRKQWFASRRIKLMIIDCRYYIQHPELTLFQVIDKIEELNKVYGNLLDVLPLEYRFKKVFYTKEGKEIEAANILLKSIKEMISSLKEKENVNVKLIDRKYYRYEDR